MRSGRASRHRIFFFQAEDGIRDSSVTGVQTCALPIFDDLAKHDIGEVSIIGRGEIIDDYDLVHSFFLRRAHTNARVASGEWTTDKLMKMEIGRASCRERV